MLPTWLRFYAQPPGLLPALWLQSDWSTRRSPLWYSYPGSDSSGRWPPAPAAAGWWSESAAAAAFSFWGRPRSRHRSCARRSAPSLQGNKWTEINLWLRCSSKTVHATDASCVDSVRAKDFTQGLGFTTRKTAKGFDEQGRVTWGKIFANIFIKFLNKGSRQHIHTRLSFETDSVVTGRNLYDEIRPLLSPGCYLLFLLNRDGVTRAKVSQPQIQNCLKKRLKKAKETTYFQFKRMTHPINQTNERFLH